MLLIFSLWQDFLPTCCYMETITYRVFVIVNCLTRVPGVAGVQTQSTLKESHVRAEMM